MRVSIYMYASHVYGNLVPRIVASRIKYGGLLISGNQRLPARVQSRVLLYLCLCIYIHYCDVFL